MKKCSGLFKKLIAVSLVVILALAAMVVSTTAFAGTLFDNSGATTATVTYSFSGGDSTKAGFAEGTITVKANQSSNAGKYYLYWADNTKALDGYSFIAALNVTTSGASVKMPAQTAIPADATKVIAIMANSEPTTKTVASASAVYDVPANKQFPHKSADKQYTFASYSDIHIANDSYGSGTYPYDEVHLRKAFDSAAARDVEFIVTGGDNINNQNGSSTDSEWKTYQKILADSDYCNPIYESIGNHEIWTTPVSTATKKFITATGLKCDNASLSSDHAYYTFDEPTTGDHFIMMALETNFYPDRYDEFSTTQINWVRGLLDKYKNDGHNTYIYEHAGFWKWGVGDDNSAPYYDIPLSLDSKYPGNVALQKILYDYPNAFFFCGHTHIQFADQFNFMEYDNSAKKNTAKMVHNSSVGGIRKIIAGSNTMDRTNRENETEGYFVDCYGDYVVCNGANLYYNTIIPTASYIVEGTGNPDVKPTTTTPTTSTAKSYSVSYNIANSSYLAPTTTIRTIEEGKSFECTLSDVSGKTPTAGVIYTKNVKVTMGGTDITSSAVTMSGSDVNASFKIKISSVTGNVIITASGSSKEDYIIGDVNGNGTIEVSDATLIQKSSAGAVTLTEKQKKSADVNSDNSVDVSDATRIQKHVAGKITLNASASGKISPDVSGASKADLQELMSTVSTYLSSKYTYSSYDQYMALKKEYRYCNSNISSFSASDINTHYSMMQTKYDTLSKIAGSAPPSSGNTLYFKNTGNWSTVYAYYWEGSSNNGWPGDAMTKVKDNIYKITVPADYTNIIFDNNSSQTGNLTVPGNNYIYDYSTKSWSPYSG